MNTLDNELTERIRQIEHALPILREQRFTAVQGRSCGSPGWLTDLIMCAVRWEIGEMFRPLRRSSDQELIASLARVSLGRSHNS